MSSEKENGQPSDGAETVDDYIATTIPVHVDIDVKQAVLSLGEAETILRDASSIALGPCVCRQEAQKCDAPVETCLALNQSEEDLAKEFAEFKPVTVERALEALRASHEAGLVHLAFRKPGKEITEFCSCCSCCCWLFSKLRQSDYRSQVVESAYIAKHDETSCIGCGACVERCQFDAWSPVRNGDKPSLNPEKCFGCGVCVSSCPVGAISFVPRAVASSAI